MSFTKPDAALTALDQDHTIKDIRLSVSVAMPKDKDQRSRGSRNGGGGGGGHGGNPYGSRMRGNRDSYSNRDHYYDNGGWDDYDRGSYSDRYRNNRYDRKSNDSSRYFSSGQVWRKNEYSDSSSVSQSKDVGGQLDPNLVAAVVEKTVRGVIGNMSKYD